jgi:hypothetical protein
MGKIRALITWLLEGTAQAMSDISSNARDDPRPPHVHPQVRFEPVDVDATKVFYTGVGVVVAMLVLTALVYPVYSYLESYRARHSVTLPSRAGRTQLPPQPRLQQNPRRDLESFRAYEDGRLNSYGWIDRSKGVVSMPIDHAMQLTLQRGIPPRPAPPGNVYFNPHEGNRLTGFEEKVEPPPR